MAEFSAAVEASSTIEAAMQDADGEYLYSNSVHAHPRIYGGKEVDPPGKYSFMVNLFKYEVSNFYCLLHKS